MSPTEYAAALTALIRITDIVTDLQSDVSAIRTHLMGAGTPEAWDGVIAGGYPDDDAYEAGPVAGDDPDWCFACESPRVYLGVDCGCDRPPVYDQAAVTIARHRHDRGLISTDEFLAALDAATDAHEEAAAAADAAFWADVERPFIEFDPGA